MSNKQTVEYYLRFYELEGDDITSKPGYTYELEVFTIVSYRRTGDIWTFRSEYNEPLCALPKLLANLKQKIRKTLGETLSNKEINRLVTYGSLAREEEVEGTT